MAVNGACLTINSKSSKNFNVEVMPETLRRTNLGDLKVRDLVNLELAMRAQDMFAGHIVQGHVDGMATIKSIKMEGNSRIFTFRVDSRLSRYVVEKGSIAVNGISLTVIDVDRNSFTVGIIPVTWKRTMFKYAKVGDSVNIEVDILAKYVEKQLKAIDVKNA